MVLLFCTNRSPVLLRFVLFTFLEISSGILHLFGFIMKCCFFVRVCNSFYVVCSAFHCLFVKHYNFIYFLSIKLNWCNAYAQEWLKDGTECMHYHRGCFNVFVSYFILHCVIIYLINWRWPFHPYLTKRCTQCSSTDNKNKLLIELSPMSDTFIRLFTGE
jgi:hypothetical protein